MHPFAAAVLAQDENAMFDLLADDVVFTSPVAFKPYEGKFVTGVILRAVSRIFTDFRYEREISSADGRDHALVFRAKVDGKDLQGCDFLHLTEDGLIDDFTVMVRPLSAAKALAERVAVEFQKAMSEAG